MKVFRFRTDSTRSTNIGCLTIVLLLAILPASSLAAANPTWSLNQYLHTSWTQDESRALPPIQGLAQTADGYLWLSTSNGLIRFDGMRFTDWSPASGPALPSSNASCLRAASRGGLWVATTAGLCRVDRGRVIRYPATEKLPCPVIGSMLEDRLGRVWMLTACPTASTLTMLSPDGHVQTFRAGDGLPDARIRVLFQDRHGDLWLGTTRGVCRWSPGTQAVCFKNLPLEVSAIAETPDGQLMIADNTRNQVFRFSNGQLEPAGPRLPESGFGRNMLCDREGNVWIGTMGQGLLRIRKNGVDRFTRIEGLSANIVTDLIEDREGDMWVATGQGLDRISNPEFQRYTIAQGLSGDLASTLYTAPDGAVWIGTSTGLNRLDGEHVTVYSRDQGLPRPGVVSLYGDAAGKLWAGTSGGLAQQTGDRFVEVLTASGQHLSHVFNMGGNRSGTVWLADGIEGLLAVRGGVAHPVTVPGCDVRTIYGLLVARNGDVWLGFFHGGIAVLSHDSVQRFDSHDGLGNGGVHTFYEDGEGSIWAGTGEGLSRYRHGRWTNWTAAQGVPQFGVQGIVDDGAAGLWLMTGDGLLHLPDRSVDGAVKPLPLSGRTEGLRLGTGMTSPRFARSRDGRLWICSEDSVMAIDPAQRKTDSAKPPVAIEQVIADGKAYDPDSRSEVGFRGHDLQIAYTGLSLKRPERVQFRYRLDHLDRDWTEAHTRRNVTYLHLPPGSYTFRVIASNNDGLWNDIGATVRVRVDPYFYQTLWFAALCVLAALMMVWFAHHLKVRRVVSRLQLIAAERTRFSRELHDSLLQGFSGVIYLLEAAAKQFETAPELSKRRLERALDQADLSLREAREMIVSMRIPALESHTLPEALRSTTAEMVSGIPVDFQFEIKGRVHQGPYDVEANLFLIAREAVSNSLNHAAANRIRLELCYTPKHLHMTIQDDGTGFDPKLAMNKEGHWGFRGMRERARQIGAEFTADTAAGRGTTIGVAVVWKK